MDHSPDDQTRQGSTLLQVATRYHRRGWSIIPIRAGTKRPACRSWKKYQTERPTEATLRRWFGPDKNHGKNYDKNHGLAVICGKVSGGLVCRDFDQMEAYERWAAAHPDLANTLPTVATAHGRHVYCRSAHQGIVVLGNGELRGAGYCLLPPSRHPDGPEYRWLIPLPNDPLPSVDVEAAGFLDRTPRETESTESTEENRGLQKTTEAIVGGGGSAANDLDEDVNEDLEKLILESLPIGPGRRNQQVFELARALKSIPRLTDAATSNLECLKPLVQRWHALGLSRGVIATEPFEETWIDFLQAWPKVKYPKGAGPMVAILQQARSADLPQAARRYEVPGLRLLVALCRELQRASGSEPFYLAVRTAGKLLEVDHVTAWRWLFLLAHDGVVEEVEKGDRAKRRASRYRYCGD